MRMFKFDGRGNLIEDPIGYHVGMTYRGRDLLGTVVDVEERRGDIPRLVVQHFNGEYWPVMPLANEVSVLVRTFDDEED